MALSLCLNIWASKQAVFSVKWDALEVAAVSSPPPKKHKTIDYDRLC